MISGKSSNPSLTIFVQDKRRPASTINKNFSTQNTNVSAVKQTKVASQPIPKSLSSLCSKTVKPGIIKFLVS